MPHRPCLANASRHTKMRVWRLLLSGTTELADSYPLNRPGCQLDPLLNLDFVSSLEIPPVWARIGSLVPPSRSAESRDYLSQLAPASAPCRLLSPLRSVSNAAALATPPFLFACPVCVSWPRWLVGVVHGPRRVRSLATRSSLAVLASIIASSKDARISTHQVLHYLTMAPHACAIPSPIGQLKDTNLTEFWTTWLSKTVLSPKPNCDCGG